LPDSREIDVGDPGGREVHADDVSGGFRREMTALRSDPLSGFGVGRGGKKKECE
jgi:hypothetical protein